MSEPIRVVLDCNVYIQALLSARGAAYGCWSAVVNGQMRAIVTEAILAEVERVTEYPNLQRKRSLTHFKVCRFLDEVRKHVVVVSEPPSLFTLDRDPDDAKYINVALDADCSWVVTRDRDLLDLMRPDDPVGESLRRLSQALRVVDPEAMLELLRAARPTE